MLLWLWCRLAAVAPIRPLAWQLLYAMHEALKSKTNKQKTKKETKKRKQQQKNQITATFGRVWPILFQFNLEIYLNIDKNYFPEIWRATALGSGG